MLAWWRRLRARRSREEELEQELQSHLEAEIEEQLEAGRGPRDAEYAARRAFGSVLRVKEDVRATWGWTALETFLQDLRLGARLLVHHSGFALFSILSLALGIGATSSVFSLFDAVVLRRLPVQDPEQLVVFWFTRAGGRPNSFLPYPHFERMRDDNKTLDGVFAWSEVPRLTVELRGEQGEVATAVHVTGRYHQTLGIRPAAGRLLTEEDDRPGAAAVAVVSYGYWQRRFGRSPSLVGTALSINQVPFTVVGVEPPGFFGAKVGAASDIALPMRTRDLLNETRAPWTAPFATWIEVMGRLKPGITLREAQADLNLIFRRVNGEAAAALPADSRSTAERIAREANLVLEPGATGGASGLRHGYEPWLRLLLMMLGAVLLLACLNLATLLSSRAEARRKEIAMRLALGAGRSRIIRQLLTESLLLASLGSLLGILLAWWGSHTLLRTATPNFDSPPVALTPDLRMVGFSVAVSALTCLLFGLPPALRATSDQGPPSARQVGTRRRRSLDRFLVTCQVALSIVLLVSAGLSLRSLQNLWAQDTGYDRSNVLMFSLDARLAGKRGGDVSNVYQRVLRELQTMPAARQASVSSVRPVSDGYYFISVVKKLGEQALPEDRPIRVAYNDIGPGYFSTLGIPLLAGRDFDEQDREHTPSVAILSEKMARHLSGNPIGQTITMAEGTREVVGVTRDVRYARVRDAPREVIYLPLFQKAPRQMWFAPTFEIRYAGTTADALRSMREAVARVDPGLTPFRVKTLAIQTEESLSRERLLALLATYFGGFALLLACIGLYGLLSYTVTQRTPELGLRMALGAQPAGIRWMVMKESLLTTLAGVSFGLLAAILSVRLIQSQLFGLQPADPVALIGASLVLWLPAMCASYFPARRASRIDPMAALRQE